MIECCLRIDLVEILQILNIKPTQIFVLKYLVYLYTIKTHTQGIEFSETASQWACLSSMFLAIIYVTDICNIIWVYCCSTS